MEHGTLVIALALGRIIDPSRSILFIDELYKWAPEVLEERIFELTNRFLGSSLESYSLWLQISSIAV